MWPRHLAPDDANFGAPDLLLTTVNIRDTLAEVEAVTINLVFEQGDRMYATYLAALVSSTPSILMRLVRGCVVRRPRW